MTSLTRVQIKLQDSGSIIYKDLEDDVIFHIEPMRDSDSKDPTGGYEDETATADLIKSFLRQHLLKNGESSYDITPLMRQENIEPLLNALIRLHLRKDGQTDNCGGCDGGGAAVVGIYKALGVLVSLLQQRNNALKVVTQLIAPGYNDTAEVVVEKAGS